MMPLRTGRPRLVQPADFGTAARADLALAIAARDAFVTTMPDRFAADQILGDRVSLCRADLRAAEKALADTKQADAGTALSAALGEAGHPASGAAKARAAVQMANDALEMAEAALAALPARVDAADAEQARLEKRVEAAATAVLREHPAIAAMPARVAAMQREMVVLMTTLHWLRGAGVIATATYECFGPNISDQDRLLNTVIGNLSTQPRNWSLGEDNSQNVARLGSARWEQALDDLKADPAASLPDVVLP